MKDYIEREAVLNAFNSNEANMFENCRLCECLDGAQIHKIIKAIPAADVRENVKGEWVYTHGHYECSICGQPRESLLLGRDADFCPHCGADMREENKTPEG